MLLSKILPKAAQMHPTNDATKDKIETLTYEQLFNKVNRVAQGFHDLAIKPGDRIALLSHPSPYLAIAELAAVAIGAIPVTIFPGLAANEIKQIVQDAAPVALVYSSEQSQLLESLSSLPIAHFISCRSDHSPLSLQSFITDCPSLSEWHEADLDDIALIIYTGGTTGRSKGVMHSHRHIRNWSFMNLERGGGHHPTKKSIVMNQAHLTGQFILWTTLYEGGCLIYPNDYPVRAEEVVDIIERERIKYLGTVGLLFRDIVHLENIKSRSLHSIEGISCGGAPINEKLFHQALDIFPNAQITEVYSQTESGQFISFLNINQCFHAGKLNRLLSVGNPANMPFLGQKAFHIRIIDDLGHDVKQGETGEIICKGDQIMLGYWNNQEETNKTLRNGWLYTGDLGRFDEDGYLYLMDRKKDIIIVDGSNVYCSEVEEVLSKHPSILEVAVIGTPMSDDGEEVTAVVSLKDDSELTLGDLKLFCLEQIAEFKIPARLEIVKSLPRTSVGKLNKSELRKPYWLGRTRMIN
ncbi:class I adenylate-forming enzyme family protein [Bacillus sp. FJAT-28004]|uniref:class I adenylate-forming enzyme family protein n=1 Tax=Bacillus sp. FJAT-28004 TaxID=1679165 RepID=UPI0006B51C7C|nr:class I adenylate-forming enzyme family protein [Bacillus sp. FJAT-28004]